MIKNGRNFTNEFLRHYFIKNYYSVNFVSFSNLMRISNKLIRDSKDKKINSIILEKNVKLCKKFSSTNSNNFNSTNNEIFDNVNNFKNNYNNDINTQKTSTNTKVIIDSIENSATYNQFKEHFLIKFEIYKNDPIPEQIEFWSHSLKFVSNLIADKSINKDEILNFLAYLNFYQPKHVKRIVLEEILQNPYYSKTLNDAHQKEYFNLNKSNNPFIEWTLQLKDMFFSFKNQILKETMDKEQKKIINLEMSVNDLQEIYRIFFENVERKVIDDLRYGRTQYSFDDCILIIHAFGIAKEGTNLLYEVLMRKISKRFLEEIIVKEEFSSQDKDTNFYQNSKEIKIFNDEKDLKTKVELIEILTNFLPHDLYNEQLQQINESQNPNEFHMGRDSHDQNFIEEGITEEVNIFYNNLYKVIKLILPHLNTEQILNISQGALRIRNIDNELVKSILAEVLNKISNSKSEEMITKEDIFKFIEIITYYIKRENKYEQFISDIIGNLPIIEKYFIEKYKSTFNMKEIATIFWFYFHIEMIDENLIISFHHRIDELLNNFVTSLKKYIDNNEYNFDDNYKNSKSNISLHKIDRYDIEAMIYFCNDFSHLPLIKKLKNTLSTMDSYKL